MIFGMLKQDESLTKELVAPQFHPQSHHGTLSTHNTHSLKPGPSFIFKLFQKHLYHPLLILAAHMGTGEKKSFLCPSLSLVDEPIMEEPEEEGERRDVGMQVGEAENGMRKESTCIFVASIEAALRLH